MTTTPTRIYKVVHGTETHLVRATHPNRAINHVAKGLITATIATQDDLVQLMTQADVSVEVAGEE